LGKKGEEAMIPEGRSVSAADAALPLGRGRREKAPGFALHEEKKKPPKRGEKGRGLHFAGATSKQSNLEGSEIGGEEQRESCIILKEEKKESVCTYEQKGSYWGRGKKFELTKRPRNARLREKNRHLDWKGEQHHFYACLEKRPLEVHGERRIRRLLSVPLPSRERNGKRKKGERVRLYSLQPKKGGPTS